MPWKVSFALAVSLLVGFAAASWIDGDARIRSADPITDTAARSAFDRSLPMEERIQALEQAVSDERSARQLLQEEVLFLSDRLKEASAGGPPLRKPGISVDAVARREESRPETRSRRPEDRAGQLLQAGFTAGEAEWITRRESELQMAALQARYEAGQSGDESAWWRSRGETSATLRAELGEAGYERYLEASGRSTSVTVGTVIESSPAQRAGLLPGDRITRYGGERTFGMNDLTRQTMEGAPGQQVVVDIVRDGQPMQVVIPRGPLGISGGRRYDGG
jgi:hypothetical protein